MKRPWTGRFSVRYNKVVKVILGSDHRGVGVKGVLISYFNEIGVDFVDVGTNTDKPVDYPKIAVDVAKQVKKIKNSLGILICRSGEGMEMAANKISGIRAALVWNSRVARETRQDNDANVLVLPSDYLNIEECKRISKVFIDTPFSKEERHTRRIKQLNKLDNSLW